MKPLLLLLLVLANALAASALDVRDVRAAAQPAQPAEEGGDDAAVTQDAWSRGSRAWRFETATPRDWLPEDEGYIDTRKKPPPKPKKAPAKPKVAAAKPKVAPAKPKAGAAAKPKAGAPAKPKTGTTHRPTTGAPRRGPTTTPAPRRARSLQEEDGPVRAGRRLLSLDAVNEARVGDGPRSWRTLQRSRATFQASMASMAAVFSREEHEEQLARFKRDLTQRGRHGHQPGGEDGGRHDHQHRHNGDLRETDFDGVVAEFHDFDGSGGGSGDGEPDF